MKKKFLVCALTLTFALSGCSGSSSKPASDTSTAEAAAATESAAAEEAVEEAEETIEDEAAAETNSVYQQDRQSKCPTRIWQTTKPPTL